MNASVENKVKSIIDSMGLSYIYASWRRANVRLDELIRKQHLSYPVCINVLPTGGRFVINNGMSYDAPNCVLAFGDKIPLDFRTDDIEPQVERLKQYAQQFIAKVNDGNLFKPVFGDVVYNVMYDKFDANLVLVTLTLTLREIGGECLDDINNEQIQ